ncbi:MAG: peptidoglycan-binding protein [Nannocystaceae bacterium]
MARSPDWDKLLMAVGDPSPTWPLPTVAPKFATWSVGGGRPFGCEADQCERWHAGIDLTAAPDGALILAPEQALVVGVDRGWSEGAKAAFLRTDTGLFLVLGGFKAKSQDEFGVRTGRMVKKGQELGRILGSYGMIHLETYKADSRTANSVWWRTEPPPDGLMNPTNYVERMVGGRVSLVQTEQRHEALRALGYYKGDVAAPWSAASTESLKAAQAALGVDVDGKWGPKTEDAIQRALAQKSGCTTDECSVAATAEGGRAWLPWAIASGVALTGAALGVVLARRRRDVDEEGDR